MVQITHFGDIKDGVVYIVVPALCSHCSGISRDIIYSSSAILIDNIRNFGKIILYCVFYYTMHETWTYSLT